MQAWRELGKGPRMVRRRQTDRYHNGAIYRVANNMVSAVVICQPFDNFGMKLFQGMLHQLYRWIVKYVLSLFIGSMTQASSFHFSFTFVGN